MDATLRNKVRRATARLLAMGLLALVAACSTPDRIVVQARDVELIDMVDQKVEFTSVMRGPGERGDYLTISGVDVFLDKLSGADRYGQTVTVAGRLRRFQPPASGDNATINAHYWIQDAKFVTPSVAPAQ